MKRFVFGPFLGTARFSLIALILLTFLLFVATAPPVLGATYYPVPGDNGAVERGSEERRRAVAEGYDRKRSEDELRKDVAEGAALWRAYAEAEEARKEGALAKEPWRLVDGVTNSVYGDSWHHVWGRVIAVTEQGVLINGYGLCLKETGLWAGKEKRLFFLVNFPYPVADDDEIPRSKYYMAKAVGTISIGSATLSRHNRSGEVFKQKDGVALKAQATYHKYDYGRVIVSDELTPAQVAAAQEKAAKAARAEEQRQAADARILKLEEEKAAEGSGLYQYRLGMRYLSGKGVEKDLGKARDMFQKSADLGNDDAAAELKKLAALEASQTK
jgi:TPR repeat protein